MNHSIELLKMAMFEWRHQQGFHRTISFEVRIDEGVVVGKAFCENTFVQAFEWGAGRWMFLFDNPHVTEHEDYQVIRKTIKASICIEYCVRRTRQENTERQLKLMPTVVRQIMTDERPELQDLGTYENLDWNEWTSVEKCRIRAVTNTSG